MFEDFEKECFFGVEYVYYVGLVDFGGFCYDVGGGVEVVVFFEDGGCGI